MRQDSVFSPSFGNRPSCLVGREPILQTLLAGLESASGSKGRSTVLLGQRGSGKTVLLWELAELAASLGYVVSTPTIVSDSLLSRIVEKIQDAGEKALGREPARLTGDSVEVLGFSVGLEFSREVQETKSVQFKLTQLVRRLSSSGHGTLILVDELQANSADVRELVSVYQELVGEGLDVALVMAGLPGAVSATLNDKVLTFLNRGSKLSLPPLKIGDVAAFYRASFAELGLALSDEQVRKAAEFTEGSPYLLQLVGHGIVLNADEGGALSDDRLRLSLQEAASEFENDVCETTLAALSETDIRFLVRMAEDERESSVADVAKRMGVSPDYAQKYRKRLIDAGVIESSGWGKVRFCVPYLADHLRRDYV